MVAYVNQSNNKMEAKYNYMKRNVCYHLGDFIILVLFIWSPIHFGYRSLTFEILNGIKLSHRKIN
jgi:hypothetical protein